MKSRLLSGALALLAMAGLAGRAHGDATDSVYGKEASSQAALIGIFYDLKQDQQHQPKPMETGAYAQVIDKFIQGDWDEEVLSGYYRASKPLYTTQVFVPSLDAAVGPRAFGVAKFVQPNFYLIHYKGEVVAPADGTYRFVGYGDNVCIVAADEKTVLVANRADIVLPTFKWTSTGPGSKAYPDANLVQGDWLTFKSGQVVSLDILLGESSGGSSAFFVLIEKKDGHYPDDGAGHPVLPIFQVAPYETPAVAPGSVAPKFEPTPPGQLWKALQ